MLNPVSTAQPSPGMVLNGEVVGGVGGSPGNPPPRRTRLPLWWRALSILTMGGRRGLVLHPVVSDDRVGGGRCRRGPTVRRPELLTGIHQQDAFDQIAGVIGGTEVTSINFYDSSISVSAPTSPGARTVDRYEWKAGVASRIGPDYSQPDDLQGELFDAADIDLSIVATLVRQSLDDARIEGVDGVYPVIRRPDVGKDPVIDIPVSGTYFDAYYSYPSTVS